MRLEEAIATAGGAVTTERMAEVMTAEGAEAVHGFMGVVSMFADITAESAGLGAVYFAITESPSMYCRARRLDAESSVILIPLGVLARTRVLTRRLLSHLAENKPFIHMVGSPLDERTFPYELAPDLVPVFGAIEDEARHWQELARFDRRTPEHEPSDAFAVEVMADCCYYLALHELMHILHRHDLVTKAARAGDPRVPAGLDADKLRRGLELNADAMAAFHHGRLQTMHPVTSDYVAKHKKKAFSRMSFAVALLFGMYDTHCKTVYDYDGGFYTHPVLRYEFWNSYMLKGLQGPGRRERRMTKAAQEGSLAGWRDCVVAYNALEFACMAGEYGSSPEPGGTGRFIPITALKYGGAAALGPRALADEALTAEVAGVVEAVNGGG